MFVWGKIESYCSAITEPGLPVENSLASAPRSVLFSILRRSESMILPWIIERLDRKLMSRGLISYRRLVGSCSKMALDGSIIVEICDETMAKMWRKPVEM